MSRVLLPPPILKRAPGRGAAYALKEGPAPVAYTDPASRRTGIDKGRMTATFRITEEIGDRVGDVVVARGLFLGNFKRNAIGYYDHKQSPPYVLPIGKWSDPAGHCTLKQVGNGWDGTIHFSQTTQDAATIFALVDEQILVSASIGFNPLAEPEQRSYQDDSPNSLQSGYRFPRIDLLEISVVGVPALPTATLVRSVLSRGTVGGEKITPRVKSLLLPLAEPRKAWSPGVGAGEKKCAGNAGCKCGCQSGDDMSKKWKKRPPAGKALAESEGHTGGYAVPQDESEKKPEPGRDEAGREPGTEKPADVGGGDKAMHARIKEYTSAIMEHHAKDAHPDGPHDAHYHADRSAVHHTHHPEADAGHLALVKADLDQIEGLREVHQHTEHPEGDGWEQVYQHKTAMGAEETITEAEDEAERTAAEEAPSQESLEKDPTAEEVTVPARRASFEWTLEKRIAAGIAIQGIVEKSWNVMPAERKDALEECVHNKIPKIAEDHPEMDEDQRVAVAYSMCGEKLFGSAWLKTLAKAMQPEDDEQPGLEPVTKDEEEEADEAPPEGDPEAAAFGGEESAAAEAEEQQLTAEGPAMPPGAEDAQHVIDYLQGCLDRHEPEARAFLEDILGYALKLSAERYPDIFEGLEGKEGEGEEAEEGETGGGMGDPENLHAADHTPEQNEESRRETQEAASLYRSGRSYFAKRMHQKGLRTLKGAAYHLEKLGDEFAEAAEDGDASDDEHKYYRERHKACAAHAKNLHELHKEMTWQGDADTGAPAYEVSSFSEKSQADWAAVASALEATSKRIDRNGELFYRLTGQRAEN